MYSYREMKGWGAGIPNEDYTNHEEDIYVGYRYFDTFQREVAQVYVSAPKGTIEKPAQELKAFAKTRTLQPGESQTLTMQIAKRDLASFDEAGSQWLAEAGTYTFRVGASSRDIRTTASVKMGAYAEKVHNVMAPKERLRLLKQ